MAAQTAKNFENPLAIQPRLSYPQIMRDKTPAASTTPLPPGILKKDLERVQSFFETKRGRELQNKMYSGATEEERTAARKQYDEERAVFDSKPENQGIDQFEIWETERFGWCIPTLLISNPGRQRRAVAQRMGFEASERTYGISMKGEIVTIGGGPHLKQRLTVHVSAARQPDLAKYLELKEKGERDANSIRDRISTRRAQTSLRRSMYGY